MQKNEENMDSDFTNLTKSDKKKRFLKFFDNNNGHISNTCKKLGISRQTYYDWCEEDENFKLECLNVKESIIDETEDELRKLIKAGNPTAIIFKLKTQGKDRGYSERNELELIRPIEEIDFEDI